MGDSQSRTKRIVRWTIGVAIGALVVATVAGWLTAAYRVVTIAPGGSLEVKVARSISSAGVRNVTINGVSEAIRLTDSADGSFNVHLTGTAATSDPEAVPKLVAEKKGDTLRVVVDHRPGLSFGLHGAQLMLEVSIPRGYAGSLAVESVSGAINAAPHRYASFSARTTSGSIELDSLRSPLLSVHSVSGAVTARSVTADSAELGTTSGSIRLSGGIPAIRIRSVSGAVTADTTAPPSHIEIASTSGRVDLSLPASSRFTLDARSTSGSVGCDFPILVTGSGGSGRHELAGTVGGPDGGRVSLRTTSGAIRVGRT